MGTRWNSGLFSNAEEHLLSERGRNVCVWSQNDNLKIAWARANPKCVIIGIFGGINRLRTLSEKKKIERSQNIHDQNTNAVTMLCTLTFYCHRTEEDTVWESRCKLFIGCIWTQESDLIKEVFNWFSLSQIFFCVSQVWESFNSLLLIPGDNLSPCQPIIGQYFFPQIALHLAFTIVEWNMQILIKVYSEIFYPWFCSCSTR